MSWVEGYHVVETKMAEHFNKVFENDLDFPLIVGMAGGVHLYKPLHGTEDEKPWNWTGWIPRQKRWLSEGKFFSNRYAYNSELYAVNFIRITYYEMMNSYCARLWRVKNLKLQSKLDQKTSLMKKISNFQQCVYFVGIS